MLRRSGICITWNLPFQMQIYLIKVPLNVNIVKKQDLLHKRVFENFMKWGLKGRILGLLGMYFDAVVVEVENYLLFFRLALAMLWDWNSRSVITLMLASFEVENLKLTCYEVTRASLCISFMRCIWGHKKSPFLSMIFRNLSFLPPHSAAILWHNCFEQAAEKRRRRLRCGKVLYN